MGGGEELAGGFEHTEDVRMLHHDGRDVVGDDRRALEHLGDVPRSPAGRDQGLEGAGIDARSDTRTRRFAPAIVMWTASTNAVAPS